MRRITSSSTTNTLPAQGLSGNGICPSARPLASVRQCSFKHPHYGFATYSIINVRQAERRKMARGEHAVLGFINESNAGNFPKQLERRAGESASGAKPHRLGGLDPAGLALIVACHRPARPPRLVGDDFQSA